MTIVVTLKNAILESADQLVSSFFFRKRKKKFGPSEDNNCGY